MAQITDTTFSFLKDLKENNNREWFKSHKKHYDQSHAEMIAFVDELLAKVQEFDLVETPSGKKALMRIYRDVRFSKNKMPYKIHWGGGFRRLGADRRGGYYFHIEPGNTFIGGGFWGPNRDDLLHIRKHLEVDAEPLRTLLKSKSFKDYFGTMHGEQLKTAPKGFDREHENIDLLRYKQYLISHEFTDQEVLSKNFVDKIAKGLENMLPFFTVFSEYLTTDLNGVSII